MVDAQYRPNLIQALSRSPFPPPNPGGTSPDKTSSSRKNSGGGVTGGGGGSRLPDPVLFPYLSRRLASSNIDGEGSEEAEFDSDVDAAAAAMLSFKHGPIVINQKKNGGTARGERR